MKRTSTIAASDNLRNYIRARQEALGLSLAELSRRGGLSRSDGLTRLMRGDTHGTIGEETAQGIGRALGLTMDQLRRISCGMPKDTPNDEASDSIVEIPEDLLPLVENWHRLPPESKIAIRTTVGAILQAHGRKGDGRHGALSGRTAG